MKEEAKTAEVQLALSPDPSAVPRALRALGEFEGRLSAEEMEDLRLLVGELVTNALLHAGLGSGDESSWA